MIFKKIQKQKGLGGASHDFNLHSFSMDTGSITGSYMGIYPVHYWIIFKSNICQYRLSLCRYLGKR